MAEKYIRNSNGYLQEVEATDSSTGVADAGKIPALDGSGRVSQSMMPVGVGADVQVMPASELIGSGAMVSVWLDGTTVKARKADATVPGKEVDGFVLDGANAGNNVTVYFEGRNTNLTGLTPGAMYYLSTTPGEITDTPPSNPGNIVQRVGKATETTSLNFEVSQPIELA